MSEHEFSARRGPTMRPGVKSLPALEALVLIGFAVYASQISLRSAPTVLANSFQQNGEDKALAQATKAAEAGKRFLRDPGNDYGQN
jgi:hypothetical protein